MSKIVFILGAGASKLAGAPLMNDFFDAAEAAREKVGSVEERQYFDAVFEGIAELTTVNSKAVVDPHNLESVFGAFEMASMCGRLGTFTAAQIESLGPSLRRVIVNTLDTSIQLPVKEGKGVLAPRPYGDFIKLAGMLTEARMGSVSCITLNYDIALDYALHRQRIDVDYCLGDSKRGGFPVMKLHGSLNWARCRKCSEIVAWPLIDYFAKYNWGSWIIPGGPKTVSVGIASHLADLIHCGQPCENEAVIVPPTWNKAQYRDLVTVWKRAAAELAEAHTIVVIGYSLPPTDEFFRYLYAIGTSGRTRLKRFWVVDPDTTGEVNERFMRLLGPVVKDRRIYQRIQATFDEGLRGLAVELLDKQLERET